MAHKTFSQKPADVSRRWILIDASQAPLGRTANALINNEIRTVHDLVTLTEQDLRELKGFGSKALDEVKDKLAELEL